MVVLQYVVPGALLWQILLMYFSHSMQMVPYVMPLFLPIWNMQLTLLLLVVWTVDHPLLNTFSALLRASCHSTSQHFTINPNTNLGRLANEASKLICQQLRQVSALYHSTITNKASIFYWSWSPTEIGISYFHRASSLARKRCIRTYLYIPLLQWCIPE